MTKTKQAEAAQANGAQVFDEEAVTLTRQEIGLLALVLERLAFATPQEKMIAASAQAKLLQSVQTD